MKRKMIIIVVLSLLFAGTFGYFTSQKYVNAQETFESSGYILVPTEDEKTDTLNEQCFFSAGTTYRESTLDDTISFKDTTDTKVTVSTDNFLHYDDGSLAVLSNSVLLDTDDINENQPSYYSISSKSVLTKTGTSYTTNNAGSAITFKNFIWKISAEKYMIVSGNLKLVVSDTLQQTFGNYLEVQYLDEGVVYIVNEDGTYSTISSDAYIELDNGIRVYLGSKNVSDGENILVNMSQMVVDSDDNIEVIPDEDYKKENVEDPQIIVNATDGEDGADAEEGDPGEKGNQGTKGSNGKIGTSAENANLEYTGMPEPEFEIATKLNDSTSEYFEVTSTGLAVLFKYNFHNGIGESVQLYEYTDDTGYFIYSNGSMAVGVKSSILIDTDILKEVNKDYCYFISNESILNHHTEEDTGKVYFTTDNQGNEVRLQNFVWKIAGSDENVYDYLAVSNTVTLYSYDASTELYEQTTYDDGYVEFQYDNGNISIVYEDGSTAPVPANSFIELENGIRINLPDLTVIDKDDASKETLANLLNMAITDEGNIKVVPSEGNENTEQIPKEYYDFEYVIQQASDSQVVWSQTFKPDELGMTSEGYSQLGFTWNSPNVTLDSDYDAKFKNAAANGILKSGMLKPNTDYVLSVIATYRLESQSSSTEPITTPVFEKTFTTKDIGFNFENTDTTNTTATFEIDYDATLVQNYGLSLKLYDSDLVAIDEETLKNIYVNLYTYTVDENDNHIRTKANEKFGLPDSVTLYDMNSYTTVTSDDGTETKTIKACFYLNDASLDSIDLELTGLTSDTDYYAKLYIAKQKTGLESYPNGTFNYVEFKTLKDVPTLSTPRLTVSNTGNSLLATEYYYGDFGNGIYKWKYDFYRVNDTVGEEDTLVYTSESPDGSQMSATIYNDNDTSHICANGKYYVIVTAFFNNNDETIEIVSPSSNVVETGNINEIPVTTIYFNTYENDSYWFDNDYKDTDEGRQENNTGKTTPAVVDGYVEIEGGKIVPDDAETTVTITLEGTEPKQSITYYLKDFNDSDEEYKTYDIPFEFPLNRDESKGYSGLTQGDTYKLIVSLNGYNVHVENDDNVDDYRLVRKEITIKTAEVTTGWYNPLYVVSQSTSGTKESKINEYLYFELDNDGYAAEGQTSDSAADTTYDFNIVDPTGANGLIYPDGNKQVEGMPADTGMIQSKVIQTITMDVYVLNLGEGSGETPIVKLNSDDISLVVNESSSGVSTASTTSKVFNSASIDATLTYAEKNSSDPYKNKTGILINDEVLNKYALRKGIKFNYSAVSQDITDVTNSTDIAEALTAYAADCAEKEYSDYPVYIKITGAYDAYGNKIQIGNSGVGETYDTYNVVNNIYDQYLQVTIPETKPEWREETSSFEYYTMTEISQKYLDKTLGTKDLENIPDNLTDPTNPTPRYGINDDSFDDDKVYLATEKFINEGEVLDNSTTLGVLIQAKKNWLGSSSKYVRYKVYNSAGDVAAQSDWLEVGNDMPEYMFWFDTAQKYIASDGTVQQTATVSRGEQFTVVCEVALRRFKYTDLEGITEEEHTALLQGINKDIKVEDNTSEHNIKTMSADDQLLEIYPTETYLGAHVIEHSYTIEKQMPTFEVVQYDGDSDTKDGTTHTNDILYALVNDPDQAVYQGKESNYKDENIYITGMDKADTAIEDPDETRYYLFQVDLNNVDEGEESLVGYQTVKAEKVADTAIPEGLTFNLDQVVLSTSVYHNLTADVTITPTKIYKLTTVLTSDYYYSVYYNCDGYDYSESDPKIKYGSILLGLSEDIVDEGMNAEAGIYSLNDFARGTAVNYKKVIETDAGSETLSDETLVTYLDNINSEVFGKDYSSANGLIVSTYDLGGASGTNYRYDILLGLSAGTNYKKIKLVEITLTNTTKVKGVQTSKYGRKIVFYRQIDDFEVFKRMEDSEAILYLRDEGINSNDLAYINEDSSNTSIQVDVKFYYETGNYGLKYAVGTNNDVGFDNGDVNSFTMGYFGKNSGASAVINDVTVNKTKTTNISIDNIYYPWGGDTANTSLTLYDYYLKSETEQVGTSATAAYNETQPKGSKVYNFAGATPRNNIVSIEVKDVSTKSFSIEQGALIPNIVPGGGEEGSGEVTGMFFDSNTLTLSSRGQLLHSDTLTKQVYKPVATDKLKEVNSGSDGSLYSLIGTLWAPDSANADANLCVDTDIDIYVRKVTTVNGVTTYDPWQFNQKLSMADDTISWTALINQYYDTSTSGGQWATMDYGTTYQVVAVARYESVTGTEYKVYTSGNNSYFYQFTTDPYLTTKAEFDTQITKASEDGADANKKGVITLTFTDTSAIDIYSGQTFADQNGINKVTYTITDNTTKLPVASGDITGQEIYEVLAPTDPISETKYVFKKEIDWGPYDGSHQLTDSNDETENYSVEINVYYNDKNTNDHTGIWARMDSTNKPYNELSVYDGQGNLTTDGSQFKLKRWDKDGWDAEENKDLFTMYTYTNYTSYAVYDATQKNPIKDKDDNELTGVDYYATFELQINDVYKLISPIDSSGSNKISFIAELHEVDSDGGDHVVDLNDSPLVKKVDDASKYYPAEQIKEKNTFLSSYNLDNDEGNADGIELVTLNKCYDGNSHQVAYVTVDLGKLGSLTTGGGSYKILARGLKKATYYYLSLYTVVNGMNNNITNIINNSGTLEYKVAGVGTTVDLTNKSSDPSFVRSYVETSNKTTLTSPLYKFGDIYSKKITGSDANIGLSLSYGSIDVKMSPIYNVEDVDMIVYTLSTVSGNTTTIVPGNKNVTYYISGDKEHTGDPSLLSSTGNMYEFAFPLKSEITQGNVYSLKVLIYKYDSETDTYDKTQELTALFPSSGR